MKIVLVGAGPANLFLALKCLEKGHEVHLFEKTKGAGKKFLVAGKSGLNLTHSEDIESFSKRYYENEEFFLELLKDFSNDDLRSWINSLGVETFVGSSKRVFPKELKAIEILKLWQEKLKSFVGFNFYTGHQLSDIQSDYVEFNGELKVEFDKVVYALGGASWSKTGSDGSWVSLFNKHKIETLPFKPMNCGFEVEWSEVFRSKFDRVPVKNIIASIDSKKIKGELMLTSYGLEGTPIYTLSREIRNDLEANGEATIYLDLKPDLNTIEIKSRLEQRRSKDSLSNTLRKKLKFDSITVSLIKECSTKDEFDNDLPKLIKNLPIKIKSSRPIEEAISTSGGIAMDEIDENFMLKKLPNHYVIGEMLDWDTITGGYLLQMCFSQAYRVANSLSK